MKREREVVFSSRRASERFGVSKAHQKAETSQGLKGTLAGKPGVRVAFGWIGDDGGRAGSGGLSSLRRRPVVSAQERTR